MNFYFVSDVAVDETRDTSKDENSKTESHTNEQIDSILESLSEFSL
jgi:hypothetical protein